MLIVSLLKSSHTNVYPLSAVKGSYSKVLIGDDHSQQHLICLFHLRSEKLEMWEVKYVCTSAADTLRINGDSKPSYTQFMLSNSNKTANLTTEATVITGTTL